MTCFRQIRHIYMRQKFDATISTNKPVLVNFYAPWSGACDQQLEILSDLAGKLEGNIKFTRFNIDYYQRDADLLNIKTIPTILLYFQNQEIWRNEGLINTDSLLNTVSYYLTKLGTQPVT